MKLSKCFSCDMWVWSFTTRQHCIFNHTVIYREPVGLAVVGLLPTAQAVALKYKHMVRMTSMLERDLDRWPLIYEICCPSYCCPWWCECLSEWVSESVLWYCWLGLLTCKSRRPYTYTVLVKTLNPQPINQLRKLEARPHGTDGRRAGVQHLGLMWPSRDGCTFYDLPVRVNERYARHVTDRQTDRQTNITKTKHFRWWNVFEYSKTQCRMGRWRWFWSWFD